MRRRIYPLSGQSGELNVMHRDPYCRAKLPQIKYSPELRKLKRNPIYQEVQFASGQMLKRVATKSSRKSSAPSSSSVGTPPSLLQLLARREHGIGAKHGSFTEPQRCGINNMHMANSFKPLMKLDSKVYCGALSGSGDHFVTASQDHVLRVFDASRSAYRRINRIVAKDVHWGILDVAFTKRGDEFVYSTWSTCREFNLLSCVCVGVLFHILFHHITSSQFKWRASMATPTTSRA